MIYRNLLQVSRPSFRLCRWLSHVSGAAYGDQSHNTITRLEPLGTTLPMTSLSAYRFKAPVCLNGSLASGWWGMLQCPGHHPRVTSGVKVISHVDVQWTRWVLVQELSSSHLGSGSDVLSFARFSSCPSRLPLNTTRQRYQPPKAKNLPNATTRPISDKIAIAPTPTILLQPTSSYPSWHVTRNSTTPRPRTLEVQVSLVMNADRRSNPKWEKTADTVYLAAQM